MARKKTTDDPTYAMVLERGHLVPAFADDAERLASWREGSKFWVTFSSREQRPLIVKWKALINDAIKGGNAPWTNAETADRAIKLALGMIDVEKVAVVNKDGEVTSERWDQHPKSTLDFNDKQLEELIEMEVALLYRLTGVDYEQAYRDRIAEKRHFVPDYPPPESSDNPPVPADVSDEGRGPAEVSTPSSHSGVAADQSTDPAEARTPAMMPDAEVGSAGNPASKSDAGATPSSGEEKAAGVGDVAVSPPAVRYFYHAESESLVTTADGTEAGEGAMEIDKAEFDRLEKLQDEAIAAAKAEKKKADKIKPRAKGDLNEADAAWLLGLARRLVAATEPKSGSKYMHLLQAAAQDAKNHAPRGGIGDKTKELAKQLYVMCVDIAIGTIPMDQKVIATLVGCSVADLKTPETK